MSLTAGSLFLADAVFLLGAERRESWKIGIFDTSLRSAGRLSAFPLAKELGFEGVQVSFPRNNPDSSSESPDSLFVQENRPKFVAAAKETGVAIASLAMGLLNGLPLATVPEAEGWIEECLDAMVEMNVDRVLIPFFGQADMNQHKEHQPLVIEKFKRLAPIAERKKIVLTVESYLSAEDHLKLIDAVGSDAVKVFYDVRNSKNKGYDIFHEMELLGSQKLISQIHFKEDRKRLGDGDIDFAKVCATLEKIGYDGWVVVEGAESGDWKESQIANAQFIKKLLRRN